MYKSRNTGSPNADYISIADCMSRYCLSRSTVMKVAARAEALFKYSSCYRINCRSFDDYFKTAFLVKEA